MLMFATRPAADRLCRPLRCSELAALQVQDVAVTAVGLRILMARSKTDPSALGVEIGLPEANDADAATGHRLNITTASVVLIMLVLSRWGRPLLFGAVVQ